MRKPRARGQNLNMAQFTPEQEKAIQTHDKNLIVVAGAGSGKTRVLVERYLTLLDTHPDWSLNALVAITFTKAAAAEMRERVRKELERRVQASDDVSQRKRWSGLLAQMDSARIDTIHGLCATILRANAAQAGVDPQFDVLDEVEAAILLDDVIADVLHDLADRDDGDVARLFTQYEMRQIRDVLTNGAIRNGTIETFDVDAEALFEAWRAEWQQQLVDERERVLQNPAVQAALDWQPPNGWPKDDKLLPAFITVQSDWANFAAGDAETTLMTGDAIRESIDLRGGSVKNWGSKEIVDEAKSALRTIREALQDFQENIGDPPDELDFAAARMTERWYRLVQRVRDHYAAEKRRQGWLDFDDLETRTAHLLRHYPDVRQRYQGAEFQSLLVDEFQDTNDAQWQIVQALSGLNERTGLFVVGDLKQSIYGFRGADVSVFGSVREAIGGQQQGEALPLSQSFRSHPGLIESFNALFAQLLVRDDLSPVREYEVQFDQGMTAFRPPLHQAARDHYSALELILLRNKYTTPAGEQKLNSDARRAWEAEQIARRLLALHADEAPIYHNGDYAPFDFGDAAILFQTTTHLTVYENALRALGIPFVTIAGRGYYNRQEVWDMLNLLRALHNPGDDLSLAAALRSPLFGFSDDLLLALRRLHDDPHGRTPLPLWNAIADVELLHLTAAERARIRRAATILRGLHGIAGRVTISDLLRQALAETGYLAMLTGLPNGPRLRGNVEKLVDIAEKSGRITLGAFTQYLSDLTAREAREGEVGLDASGAVQLMTVHASKGLEFPVVVLADASWDWKRGNRDDDILIYDAADARLVCKIYDEAERKYRPSYPHRKARQLQKMREEAERKRLFYVAATRARDCLIVCGELKEDKKGNRSASGWLGMILEPLGVDENTNDGDVSAYTEHGDVRISIPDYDEAAVQHLRSHTAGGLWWQAPISHEAAAMPPRLRPLTIGRQRMLGHIAATQLAGISKNRYKHDDFVRPFYKQNLLRKVLNDGPPRIKEAVRVRNPRIQARQVGEVVHEALRYWHFVDLPDDRLNDLLSSYAWQHHFIDPDDIALVVDRAKGYLAQFQTSAIYQQMHAIREAGLPFYPELPFVYRTEKRILHGVLDALFQDAAGNWVVLDYKTSWIGDMDGLSAAQQQRRAADHAQRYHLQIGAYAAAVQNEVGAIPRALIHYIQYNQTVVIPTATWQREIEQLEAHIGDLVNEDDAIIDR